MWRFWSRPRGGGAAGTGCCCSCSSQPCVSRAAALPARQCPAFAQTPLSSWGLFFALAQKAAVALELGAAGPGSAHPAAAALDTHTAKQTQESIRKRGKPQSDPSPRAGGPCKAGTRAQTVKGQTQRGWEERALGTENTLENQSAVTTRFLP